MTSTGYNLGSAYGNVIISTNVGEAMQTAQRQFDSGIAGMSASLRSWGDSLTQMGAQLSVLTSPLRGVISTGLDVVGEFDDIMTEIEARTGASVTEMDTIRAQAEKLGAESIFSAQQAGEALLQLLTSGMNVQEALATLPIVLEAAAASGESLGRTADGVTDIMAIFSLGVEDAQMVVDTLARAAGASSASMGSLVEGFSKGGAQAKMFGLSVEETAAVLAIFAENGIKGSEAGTQLGTVLLNMSRKTNDVTGAWDELGISMYDAQGNARSLESIISDLDAALDTRTMEEQNRIMTTLGGSYGIIGLSALRNSMSISTMTAKMKEQADAGEIAAKMMGTWNNMIASLQGSWETLLTRVLAPTVEEYLKPIIEGLTYLVNLMSDWAKVNPETAQTFAILGMAIAALGPVLLGIGLALSVAGGALGLLMSPIALVSAGVFTLAVVFRNQIGAIVAALTAFAAEASRPINNFLSKINQVIAHFNFLRTSGSQFFDALRSEIVYFSDSLLMFFGVTGEAADEIQESLLTAVTSIETMFNDVGAIIRVGLDNFATLSKAGSGIFDILRTEINILTPMIMKFLGITGETAKSIQQGLWEAVTGIEALFAGVGQIIPALQRWLSTLSRHIVDAVSAFMYLRDQGSNIFSALRTMITWNLRGFLELIGITGETATSVQVILVRLVNELEGFVGRVRQSFSALQTSIVNFWESLSAATPDGFISDLMAASGAADLLESALTTLQGYADEVEAVFSTIQNAVTAVTTTFRLFRAMGFSVFGAVAQEIELFAGTVLGMFGITGDAADAIQGWLVTAVLNVERLFNAARGVISSVWTWLSGIGETLGSVDLSGLSQFIEPLYHVVMLLWSLTNPLYLAWEILTILGVDFISIIEDVATGLQTFFDTLSGGGSLADAFSAIFGPEIVNGITTGVDTAMGAVQDFIDILAGIWDFVSPALTNLGNWFVNDVLPAINSLIMNAVLPALRELGEFLSALWTMVAPHLGAFAEWFLYTVLPAIQRFISDTIIPGLESLIQTVTRIWNDVSPYLLEFANWFLNDALPRIIEFINTTVMPIINEFIRLIQGIWDQVSTSLGTLYSWFIEEGLPFIMTKLGEANETFQNFIKIISGIWNSVKQGVEDFKTGLQAMVTWLDTNIVQPAVNLVNSIVNAFKGIWAAVQGPINEFKNGVMGILNGIGDAIRRVMEALGLAQAGQQEILNVGQNAYNPEAMKPPTQSEQDAFYAELYKAGGLTPPVVSNGGGSAVPYIGRFSSGSDYIKQTGMGLLHEGEAVLTKEENAARSGGSDRPTIYIDKLVANTVEEARAVARTLKEEFAEEFTFNG